MIRGESDVLIPNLPDLYGAPPPTEERRPRPSPASASRPIQIFFANINVWSKKASDFFFHPEFQDSVGCFVEHHLDGDALIAVKKKFQSIGRDCYASAATSTGRSATGTSAGAAIVPYKTLCMRSLDLCLLQHILGSDPFSQSRWQAAILRVKGASILVVTTYLVHTIGLTGDNITLLEQLLTLIRCFGPPNHPLRRLADAPKGPCGFRLATACKSRSGIATWA